jgi:GT2 family glycosyltransferase
MFTDHLKIIAKKSFLEVGLLDARYDFAQDYEFALRFAARKPQGFHYINEFLYYHRVYPGQVSKKYRQKQLQVAVRIRDQIRRKAEIRSGRRNKKLSIIIISFYRREHTFRCIEAVKNTVHGDYEIILLDNGSDAVTVGAMKDKYASDELVRMFFSEVNLGCAGGRQTAISHATGDYIVTLDNDIVVTDTWIEEMIMRIEQNEDAGGVCAKVVFPDGKIQHNGGNMTIDGHFVEFGLIDAWKDSNELSTMRERECDWIAGGATLFKREVYDRVELCKDFVNSYEDNDFALNVRKLGYKLLNCPTAVVIHNHLYYDKKTANTEHEYLAARYGKDGLKQSVTAFYRQHGLIIKDQQNLVPELKAEAAAVLSGE